MSAKPSLITVPEARRRVVNQLFRLGAERVPLERGAGRVLAAPALADHAMPPFDKACMDGFAVRSEDFAEGRAELTVTEVVGAGSVPARSVGPGEAIQVMTGAPMPQGADAVVMIELTSPLGEQRVLLEGDPAPGQNVQPLGELYREGDPVVAAGKLLRAPELALLGQVGAVELSVTRRPRVRLVATGDELVDVGETPGPGQIRDSNRYGLQALIEAHGGEWLGAERAGDTEEKLVAAFEAALEDADILLITGGVSAGEYDLVEPVLAKLGFELSFTGVRLKPGKPAVFGHRGQQLVFGLPGNPVSGLVVLMLFGVPALRFLGGHERLDLPRISAEMIAASPDRAIPREQYLPGRLRIERGRFELEPLGWRGSSDMLGIGAANAFYVIPAGGPVPALGEQVEVLLWRDPLE